MRAAFQETFLENRKASLRISATRTQARLLIAVLSCLALPASAQVSALTAQLLDDCTVMTGKTPSDVFLKAMTELRKDAENRTGRAKLHAQIANNRFACFEEEISGDAGWSVSTEPQKPHGVSESRSPLAAKLENNPQALEALRESVNAQRAIADNAPDYGLIAARQMMKYRSIYQDELPEIYSLAGRAVAVYCYYGRPKGIRQDWSYLCRDARQMQHELLPRISKATREVIDAQSNQWASGYALNAKYQRRE